MQRKILNTKKVWSGVYIQNRQKKLHSIPILLNMKKESSRNKSSKESSVLYSIPCVKACAHAFCGIKLFNSNKLNNTFAILCLSMISLVSLMGGDKCSAATSASLSLSNPNMTSSAITPGSTATVSTNVTVSVDNADSYSLSLKVDSTTLQNGSTIINAGNVTTDNTWGYKWDGASSYTAPNTTGTNLTVPTLTNNSVSFTKNLTFGAKFASTANAGHYKGSGVLSLVATPKKATLSNISRMQDMTTEICAATSENETKQLIDTRDSKTYWVAKLKDGNCWMTQNLDYDGGGEKRTTVSEWADTTSIGEYWDPGNKVGNASGDDATSSTDRHTLAGNYYNYVAALEACPAGWKIPSSNSTTESGSFGKLLSGISAGSNLIISPYYFQYSGRIGGKMSGPAFMGGGSIGTYWSSTLYSDVGAYILTFSDSSIDPSSPQNSFGAGKVNGLPVRCLFNGPTTYSLSFKLSSGHTAYGTALSTNYPTQTAQSSNNTHSFVISGAGAQIKGSDNCRYSLGGWSLTDGGAKDYDLGSTINLSTYVSNVTLYTVLGKDLGLC